MPVFQVLSPALAAIALITSLRTNRSSRITERLGRTLTQDESRAEGEQHQFITDIRTQWFSAATFGTAAMLVIAALGYERVTGGSELLPNEWTVTTIAICTLAGVAAMSFRFSHLGKKILKPRKLHPTIVAQMASIAIMIGSMAATNINPMAVILVPITTGMASIAALWGAIHDSRKPPPINPDEESQTIPITTPE